MKMSGNKIMITGGATGIGYALAEEFVRRGNDVIICGRRSDALDEAKRKLGKIISKQCDLNHPETRVALMEWINTEHPETNVLINNAGIQNWMKLTDENFDERMDIEIQTNIVAPLHLCRLFINNPAAKTIINVTSGLAFSPLSATPVYSATKAFMRSFTLSLRRLLRDRNIEVIEMIPPALNTDLGGKGIHDAYPPVSSFVNYIMPQLEAGKTELSFGYSEAMLNSVPDVVKQAFERMNP